MPQPKGHTGNPNGRPKGVPNKTTSTLRNWLLELLNNNRQLIQQDFESLEPLQRLQMVEKLLPYLMPKADNPGAVEGACYDTGDIVEVEPVEAWDIVEPTRIKQLQPWYEKQA